MAFLGWEESVVHDFRVKNLEGRAVVIGGRERSHPVGRIGSCSRIFHSVESSTIFLLCYPHAYIDFSMY